jgi:hypothetical protein
MDKRRTDVMREWFEDAAVVAINELKSDYLEKLFTAVVVLLSGPDAPVYWTVRGDVATSLAAAERKGLVERWELEYIDGKIGVLT